MEDREVAVLLDGLRSDFRAFREGLDNVWHAVNELKDEVRDGNKFLQAILSEHEDRLHNHENRLTTIEKKIA
ncbi:MAG: hypothetical protein M1536_01725 [Firmicutes bacterium]|nr:hypothetical protein [Bacillota bacterium]